MTKHNDAASDVWKNFPLAKRAVLEAYAKKFGNVRASCKAAGVSRQTFYNWKRDDASFAAALEAIDPVNELLDLAEKQLIAKLQDGDLKAVTFVLETKGAARGWTKTANVAVSGPPPLIVQAEEVGFFDLATVATSRQTTFASSEKETENPAKKAVKKTAAKTKTTKKTAKKATKKKAR